MLQDINGEESTVTLKNVKSFGTEGRGDPAQHIPPMDDTYPMVVFRGSDVHDLSVLEDEQEQPPAPEPQPAAHVPPRQDHKPRRQQTFVNTQSIPTTDFEFSNELEREATQDQADDVPSYNKSSFFDNLSSSNDQPRRPSNRRGGRGGYRANSSYRGRSRDYF